MLYLLYLSHTEFSSFSALHVLKQITVALCYYSFADWKKNINWIPKSHSLGNRTNVKYNMFKHELQGISGLQFQLVCWN